MKTYADFFKTATTKEPYDWQGRLANGDGYRAKDQTTHTGTDCVSRLIDIPTGLGKTAGVVLAWLWNRSFATGAGASQIPDFKSRKEPQLDPQSKICHLKSEIPSAPAEAWPRRLIYCLPMRTLVEKTAEETRKWINNLEQVTIRLA